jgi:outer membrane protein insertion porin family
MPSRFPLPLILLLVPCSVWSAPPTPSPAPWGPESKPVVKVIVSDVIIQGNSQIPAEQIKNLMSTRPGREYIPEKLQEDVRNLFATRQFANVWADSHPAGYGRVKVAVYVRDFPNQVLRVTFRGNNNIPREELEQTAKIRTGTPLNPVANRIACREIVRRYNEEGRPFASCTLLKGGDLNDNEVIFAINEGPHVKVRSVSFTGNTFVNSALLYNRIDSTAMFLGIIGGTFNPAMAENDVHTLIKFYRSFGFHDVKVNRELVYTGDGRELKLIFHIEEGVRYRVAAAPRVAGVKEEAGKVLEGISKMKAGEYYDEKKITGDTNRIKDYFGYRGHAVHAEVRPSFSPEQPGLVRLTYEVVEK